MNLTSVFISQQKDVFNGPSVAHSEETWDKTKKPHDKQSLSKLANKILSVSYSAFSNLQLVENITQFLQIILVVLLAIFPRCEFLVLLVHVHFPDKLEISWLHHSQFAASLHQRLEAFPDLWLLPLEEAGAEYGEMKLFALLEDGGQLGCTVCTGTG